MANSEHLQNLMEGAAAWNQWRIENPDVEVNLSKADIRDAELPGVNLSHADLRGCNLVDVDFQNANLESANLTGANLSGAKLVQASMANANLENTKLAGVDASDADLSATKLVRCNATDAILMRVTLRQANCRDAHLTGVNFALSDLGQADFRDSVLEQSIFEASDLIGIDLRRCRLNSTSFIDANLTMARLRRAQLANAVFEKAKLTRSDIRGVTGLECDQLVLAIDWQTAYRDEILACGAAIPSLGATGTAGSGSAPSDNAPASIGNLFGTEISQWRSNLTTEEQRALLERSRNALVELERAIQEWRANPAYGQMGHNNPPEALPPEDAVAEQLIGEIRAGIALHDTPRPHRRSLSRLRDYLDRFRQWLQLRVDIAADSAANTLGSSIGATMAVGATYVFAKLLGAIEALDALIASLF